MVSGLVRRIRRLCLEKIANGQPVIMNVEFVGDVRIANATSEMIELNNTCTESVPVVTLVMKPPPELV